MVYNLIMGFLDDILHKLGIGSQPNTPAAKAPDAQQGVAGAVHNILGALAGLGNQGASTNLGGINAARAATPKVNPYQPNFSPPQYSGGKRLDPFDASIQGPDYVQQLLNKSIGAPYGGYQLPQLSGVDQALPQQPTVTPIQMPHATLWKPNETTYYTNGQRSGYSSGRFVN